MYLQLTFLRKKLLITLAFEISSRILCLTFPLLSVILVASLPPPGSASFFAAVAPSSVKGDPVNVSDCTQRFVLASSTNSPKHLPSLSCSNRATPSGAVLINPSLPR